MSDLCPATANALSERLGGFDCSGPFALHLRNPAELSNWTLPVLELLMVLGAVLAVWYAVRRLRQHGDPTLVALAIAGVAYVLVVEVPLYFPGKFGIEDHLGTVFVHNVFTVDLVADRLPLYIVALYVALPVLAYEIVRRVGVLERHGAVVGAICVGAVHSAFYEVFDHLGPQLRWWAWNTDNDQIKPFFASVPMTSVVLFSLVAPAGLTFGLRRLVRPGLRPAALLGRAVLVGALVPLAMTLGALPAQVFGNHTAAAIVLWLEFAAAWSVAVPVLVGCWRGSAPATLRSGFVREFGPVYLAVMAFLWVTALPDYHDAIDGTTPDGTPIGSFAFALLCFTASLVAVVAGGRERVLVDGTQGLGRVTAGR